MKLIRLTMLIVFVGMLCFYVDAKEAQKKNITPDNGPVVTTWSKIKEMFE